MQKPIVWTIGGSDSSGGAGIQADIAILNALNTHGVTLLTAITAQRNDQVDDIQFLTATQFEAQYNAIASAFQPAAIKIGMIGRIALISSLKKILNNYCVPIILDPVLFSTSKNALFEGDLLVYKEAVLSLLPHVTLITPNIMEAECLTDIAIHTVEDIKRAAHRLLQMGVKNVVIKGGHFGNEFSQDYWTNGLDAFWLASVRTHSQNYRGTGCTFASALAASLAQGNAITDALVMAKMLINQSIRLATPIDENNALLHHGAWSDAECDLPYLSSEPLDAIPAAFPDCDQLGLYPIVDSSLWVDKLLKLGVKTIQLRIKDKSKDIIEIEIERSIKIAKICNAKLFINDEWEAAIRYGAYGVHLGQTDLQTADIDKIRNAGLRLGISTHCYAEVASAHRFRPSYIAIGPIFATTSKLMPFTPQGVGKLQNWIKLLKSYALVAIGGINLENIQAVLDTGVDNIAMISAITKAENYYATVNQLLLKMGYVTSSQQAIRYSQQIKLNEIGASGQAALKNAKVLCVGAGGLGCPLLLYLAGAGVGRLGIIDHDEVSLSNLHRQILFAEKDIGQKKAVVAKKRLLAFNQNITIDTYIEPLTHSNAKDILSEYDVIVDCTDDLAVRYLMNDICFELEKPFVCASVSKWQGQCAVFLGKEGPCFRCLFQEPSNFNSLLSCTDAGIVGVLPGMLAMIQATEVLKILLEKGALLNSRLLCVDALNMTFSEFKFDRNSDCIICKPCRILPSGTGKQAMRADMNEYLISPQALKTLLENNEAIQLIDVRTPDKHQAYNIGGKCIPSDDLPQHLSMLNTDQLIVTYCTTGGRSMRALQFLLSAGFTNIKSLDGGMTAWQDQIDNL